MYTVGPKEIYAKIVPFSSKCHRKAFLFAYPGPKKLSLAAKMHTPLCIRTHRACGFRRKFILFFPRKKVVFVVIPVLPS